MKRRNPLCVSTALMKEIIRMYWYMPVITFILYFFTGIVPILSNLSNLESIDYFIYDSMKNMNLAYTGIISVTPVITAVLMMGFLHKSDKAMMIHIQPLSKDRIFNSYYICGWLMCVVPLLIMLIPYALLAFKVEALARMNIIFWLLTSIAVMTLFYGMTVLAGTLTGTVVMNLLSTGVLMVVFPIIVGIADSYCEIFIDGYYEMPRWLDSLAESYNPAVGLLFRYENSSGMTFAIYFIAGVILSAVSRKVYKTRKLERIGSSTLSRAFEELMTYLVVFIGMSIFGLMMRSFSQSKLLVVAGMLVGTLITLFVVKLIVNRSVRIFNRDFVRSLSIYLIIAAVFVSLTVFDLSGFDKRVPDIDEIESVDMEGFVSDYPNTVTYGYVSERKGGGKDARTFTSPEALEKITELHQYIIDNGLSYDKAGMTYGDEYLGAEIYDIAGSSLFMGNEYIHIKYNLKNGRAVERMYDVYMDQNVANILDQLLTSEEYREKNSIFSYIKAEDISYIQITGLTEEYYESYYDDLESDIGDLDQYESYVMNSGNIAVVDNPNLVKKIFEAWDEDMENCGYIYNNRNMSDLTDLASIEIYLKESALKKKGEKNMGENISFIVTDADKNTLACLKEAGYGNVLGEK